LSLLLLTGCSNNEKEYSRQWIYFDTVVSIKFYGFDRPPDSLYDITKDIYSYWDSLLDVYDTNSGVYRLNHTLSDTVYICSDLSKILTKSLLWNDRTDDKLTPLIGPLVSLWGIGLKGDYIPSKELIDKAISNINNSYIEFISDTVIVKHGNPEVNLSAYAKGWVVDINYDKILPCVKGNMDIAGFLIDAGRNIKGWRRDNKTFKIGIANPRGKGIVKVFELPSGQSCASAGDYERFIIVNGKRYHQIFDPKTGYPSDKAIGATVVCKNAFDADVISTAAILLGDSIINVAKSEKADLILFYEIGQTVINKQFGSNIVFR